jgi:DNA-binding transcriptional LysR family regulator
MEIRQLNSFCWIVQSGSLKDAAKRCFLTPSALSLQIKALEQELALKLFNHKGRKLELTAQGEVFYVEARKVLNSVEEAKEKPRIMRRISAEKSLWRLPRACVISICRALPVSAPRTRPSS